MSSPAVLAAILSLEAQLSALKAQLSLPSGKTESASGKPLAPSALPKADKKAPAPKEEKKERKTSDWALFTQRVRSLLKEGGYEKKDLSVGCLQFCGDLKKENADFASWASEDILARRAAWVVPEKISVSSALAEEASVVSAAAEAADAVAEPKKRGPPKGVKLSEEEKAKRKATKEANKAAKEASASAPPSEDEAPASDAEGAASVVSSEKKKRGPPKGVKLSEEQKAQRKATREANKAKKEESSEASASAPASPSFSAASASSAASIPLPPSPKASAASAPSGFQPVMLGGHRYYINLSSGHAYHRNDDDSQGHWAGLFSRVPKPHINHSVAEPETEFAQLDDAE
jgi:hypothetical protein